MVSNNMNVGDLVKWNAGDGDDGMIGVVVQISRTGHDTTSAKVVFMDGYEGWHDSQKLEVVNEDR